MTHKHEKPFVKNDPVVRRTEVTGESRGKLRGSGRRTKSLRNCIHFHATMNTEPFHRRADAGSS